MAESNLELAEKVDLDRRERVELVRARFPELRMSGGPPEERILDLAPYLLDVPQKFYHEATYDAALRYLTDHYAGRPGDVVGDFGYVAGSLLVGLLNAEYYSRVIEDGPPAGLPREAWIRGYWCPWYLGLAEECLKPLSGPWVWALQRAQSKRGKLEDMRYVSERVQKLGTLPELAPIGKDFEGVVRNACAHGGVMVLRNGEIVFRDDRGNEVEWSDDECLDHIQGMLDVCNALAFAARVFLLRNWRELSSAYSLQALPEPERERVFLTVADTPVIDVRGAEIIDSVGTRQVTIDARDRALLREELAYDALAILRKAYRFYPDVDRVFLALEGRRHLPSWVRAPIPAIGEWVSGSLDLEGFLGSADVELMIFPFKRWGVPVPRRAIFLRRALARGLPELRGEIAKAIVREQRPWRVVEVRDKSTGPAKRLQATVMVPEGLTQRDLEPILVEVNHHVRRHLYRTEEKAGYKRRYRKAMARRPASYVWLLVFTREKRPRDMWADPSAPYYVCRTEWFDEALRTADLQPVLNLPDRVGGSDISVEWGPRYHV